jgi:hypothetical protein
MGGGRAFSAAGGTFRPPSGSARSGPPSGQPPSGAGAAGGIRAAGGGRPGGMSTSNSAITAWVKAHFKKVTIGGQTMYDLTQRVS